MRTAGLRDELSATYFKLSLIAFLRNAEAYFSEGTPSHSIFKFEYVLVNYTDREELLRKQLECCGRMSALCVCFFFNISVVTSHIPLNSCKNTFICIGFVMNASWIDLLFHHFESQCNLVVK